MSSTTIARGNARETFYISPSLTPVAVAASTTAAQTFSVPGLLTSDFISTGGYIANQTTGIFIAETDCLTNGVLTVQFGNCSTSSATPQAGVYEFQIVRFEGPTPSNAA
jgi:hypothetical protein